MQFLMHRLYTLFVFRSVCQVVEFPRVCLVVVKLDSRTMDKLVDKPIGPVVRLCCLQPRRPHVVALLHHVLFVIRTIRREVLNKLVSFVLYAADGIRRTLGIIVVHTIHPFAFVTFLP